MEVVEDTILDQMLMLATNVDIIGTKVMLFKAKIDDGKVEDG